ncbi:MAG: hypothetical protein ACM3S1_03595 [Hyphomicrobiales bacterium]
MAISQVLWKLVSPYDAYVSHVVRLNHAIERIGYFAELAQRQEASLQGSVQVGGGSPDAEVRANRFREQLATNAASMTDEEFESFIALLGGGEAAEVEPVRERARDRMIATARGMEEYFAMAGQELALLERRGYNPHRPDIARQLRENHLPELTVDDYRHRLRELGGQAGRSAA